MCSHKSETLSIEALDNIDLTIHKLLVVKYRNRINYLFSCDRLDYFRYGSYIWNVHIQHLKKYEAPELVKVIRVETCLLRREPATDDLIELEFTEKMRLIGASQVELSDKIDEFFSSVEK